MLQDKKICLDSVDNDTIAYNYDDKTIANATKSTFAGNRSFSCKNSIHRIFVQVTQSSSTHFSIFFGWIATHFQIDDIGIGKRYFQSLQDKLLLGVASEKIAIPLNAGN